MGSSLDTLRATLSLNESWGKRWSTRPCGLRKAMNNVSDEIALSDFDAIFAPVFNTPAISSVLQNGSFQAPFPSFNYEDLGLTFKVKPTVY